MRWKYLHLIKFTILHFNFFQPQWLFNLFFRSFRVIFSILSILGKTSLRYFTIVWFFGGLGNLLLTQLRGIGIKLLLRRYYAHGNLQ
jgi:hypothetical protein